MKRPPTALVAISAFVAAILFGKVLRLEKRMSLLERNCAIVALSVEAAAKIAFLQCGEGRPELLTADVPARQSRNQKRFNAEGAETAARPSAFSR